MCPVTGQVVIAGAGHAAGQVVATLRLKQYPGRILLIGEEPYLPYQRPPLSKKYLAGELPAKRLLFKPESFYDDAQIEVHLETRIETIDRAARSIGTVGGGTYDYDKLVIATGARARRLPVPGAELAGVFYLRTIDDVRGIRQQAGSDGARLVVIGAGYIGLEVAAVAAQLGYDVTVVEAQDRVMSRVVSRPVSEFYLREHESRGVRLKLSTSASGFAGSSHVEAVRLGNGDEVPADIVVIGIGIVPDTDLAAGCGLEVEDGVVVDDRCRTSDPDIYAVGDCTSHPNALFGRRIRLESVHNALEQAKTAAANICGDPAQYTQVPWFWSDQYDLKLQIAGLSQGHDQAVLRGDPDDRSFSCAYLREGRLIAVDAVNRPRDFLQAKQLIADHAMMDAEGLANADIALKDIAG